MKQSGELSETTPVYSELRRRYTQRHTDKEIEESKRLVELKRKKLLPYGKEQKFKSFYFLSLAKGFGLVKSWKRVLKYLAMSFFNHPIFFTRSFGKSISHFRFPKEVR